MPPSVLDDRDYYSGDMVDCQEKFLQEFARVMTNTSAKKRGGENDGTEEESGQEADQARSKSRGEESREESGEAAARETVRDVRKARQRHCEEAVPLSFFREAKIGGERRCCLTIPNLWEAARKGERWRGRRRGQGCVWQACGRGGSGSSPARGRRP